MHSTINQRYGLSIRFRYTILKSSSISITSRAGLIEPAEPEPNVPAEKPKGKGKKKKKKKASAAKGSGD